MIVKVEHAGLVLALRRLESLADRIDAQARLAGQGTPIGLPSLSVLPAKARWMRDQVPDLEQLAALALLLDTEGTGSVTFESPGSEWDVQAMFDNVVAQRFGPDFQESTGLSDDQFRDLMLTFGSVGQTGLPADSGIMSASDLRDLIIANPDLARALTTLRPRFGTGPEGTLAGLVTDAIVAPGGADELHEQRRLDARNLFEGLGGEQASILAMMFPSTVGNLAGVPFDQRADANTVRIVVALEDEQGELGDLRDQHEHNQHDWDFLGLNNDDLDGPIGTSEDLVDLYESILRDDRQILYFDPSGDGAMAELHGPIDSRTDNVGVLVPGTTAELSNFDSNARRSQTFSDNDPTGGLSMITWMGGDLPDSIVQDAPFANYAVDLGPGLADFSHDVRLEIERSGADSNTQVTYAGHSYGGAVVGRSELHGLDADRVMHIESAGMGHDIQDTDDLPSTQSGVDRYSMTAPGDVIGDIQGTQLGDNVGHGADPDEFEGTTRLDTGNKVDGSPNTGVSSHTTVFEVGSDAWNNMYEVFTGGTVETYRSPHYEYVGSTYGVSSYQDGWNDDGERIDIE
jgi:hypothetical protein